MKNINISPIGCWTILIVFLLIVFFAFSLVVRIGLFLLTRPMGWAILAIILFVSFMNRDKAPKTNVHKTKKTGKKQDIEIHDVDYEEIDD